MIELIKTYDDIKEFEKEAKEMGFTQDINQILELDANYVLPEKNYVVINLKAYDKEEPNNLMILSKEKNIIYTKNKIDQKSIEIYKFILQKSFGESTVLAVITLKRVLETYLNKFESINKEIDEFESKKIDLNEISKLGRQLRKLTDRVEDFMELLIRLGERSISEVNTSYISYDFNLLKAESRHLIDRCKSHHTQLLVLRSEYDAEVTKELNKRIEKMTEIMMKLTAITVIIMLPTLITSYYGMNFKHMPELDNPLAYPTVTMIIIAMIFGATLYFKKIEWL